MNTYFINESAYAHPVEVVNKNKDWIEFVAVLQEADRRNRNGRLYPKRVLESALNSPYVRERLEKQTFFGECGHPISSDPLRLKNIDPTRISHYIKDIWWEGNLLKGKVVTANTTAGKDLKGLIEQGCVIAFSLRAAGQFGNDLIVKEPMNILCYDWVINPSHDKAFMQSLSEQTKFNLYGYDNKDYELLAESVDFDNFAESLNDEIESLYNDGKVQEIVKEDVDYTPYTREKYKTLDTMFIFNRDEEKVITENLRFVNVIGETKNSKVTIDEYITKDLRDIISKI